MRSVTIITSPFACVPPHAIGAIERRWYQVSCLWRKQGLTVHMVAKLPLKEYPSSYIFPSDVWEIVPHYT